MSGGTPKFILASASPRRIEILQTLGLDFETAPAEIDESSSDGETPSDYVVRLARAKVDEVAPRYAQGLVIGADTAVVIDGRILGKPASPEEARSMLAFLAGRWHAVMTGLAVRNTESREEAADYDKTLVRFKELTQEEIEAYVSTGEPMDKAGGYAIQGRGMLFVEEIAGNYQNVVGLPATLLQRLVRRLGVAM